MPDGGGAQGPGGEQNQELMRLLESLSSRTTPPPPNAQRPRPTLTCTDRFVYISHHPSNGTCAPRCGVDVFFTREDRVFTETWMTGELVQDSHQNDIILTSCASIRHQSDMESEHMMWI